MPHLLMEYTDNLNIDAKNTLKALNQTLLASGEFSAGHNKSRALCLHDYCVDKGEEGDAFVHLTLSLLSGRSIATKTALAEALRATLEPLAYAHADVRLQMTVDVRDMQRECYAKAVRLPE